MTISRALREFYLRSHARDLVPDPLKIALRRRWVRLARRVGYPISSQRLRRPPLVRGRRELRLTRVLLASDLNPRYLEFWPLVSRAWTEIAEVEPTLVLVAQAADVPADLAADPRVRLFRPLDEVHTAFQAQCIRLLYPALLEGDGAVVISDMELMPLSPAYFHGSLAKLDATFFVAYRDVHHPRGEIAIPYNAAEPATWRDLTAVADEDDVRSRLHEWSGGLDYEGIRGGAGWYTDQRVLYRLVVPWGERTQRLWMLDDDYTGHRRLERAVVEQEGRLSELRRHELLAQRYTDFNALIPHSRFGEVNDAVVTAAIAAVREG